MSKSSKVARERAMARYLDAGAAHLNCAQTVMYCASLIMNQDPDWTDIGGYFGGGVSRMGQVCGAVSGACMSMGLRDYVMGLEDRKAWEANREKIQRFMEAFAREFGDITCAGLLGMPINSPEAFREAKRRNALVNCPRYVAWVCDRLESLLQG